MSELISELIIVICTVCERSQRMPVMNIDNSYPVILLSNAPTAMGVKATELKAYLCKQHYIDMGGKIE